MNSSNFNTEDIGMSKTGNHEVKSGANGAQITLPFMTAAEITKRLDENAKMLKEWEELINRTSKSAFCRLFYYNSRIWAYETPPLSQVRRTSPA